jgi:hypothetical protein
MKYLIPFVVVFALFGCDNQSAGPQDSAKTAAGKAESYLDKPIRGMVNQRGLYKLLRSSGVVDDPTTSTGKAVASPVIQLVKSTERIPLIKGAQMYLQYRIWYLPDQPVRIDLRRVLKHPEMTLPDGSVSTGSDFMMKGKVSVNQAIGYTGYGFDEDYELVEGDWIFEVWHQDKKLIEQKFTTYRPNEEETAELKQLLEPQKHLREMASTDNKKDPRLNWPRVKLNIGEDPIPKPTVSSNEPSSQP